MWLDSDESCGCNQHVYLKINYQSKPTMFNCVYGARILTNVAYRFLA